MSISSVFTSLTNAKDPMSAFYVPPPIASSDVSSELDQETKASQSTFEIDTVKLLKKLELLAQSNPARFKKVTADIALQMQVAAQTVGGSQSEALSSLASKFQQASQTGMLSMQQHRDGHQRHKTAIAGTRAMASSAYKQNAFATHLQSQIARIISNVLTPDTDSAAIMVAA